MVTSDFWIYGPAAAALSLRSMGFSAREAERLVSMKLRYVRGDFRKPTLEEKRLRFVRWLVEHGRISDHIQTREETPALQTA